MSTEIYIITHAVTQWHVKGKAQGHVDTPLNSYGRKMAEAIAERFRDITLHSIYSSDLRRAYETVEPLSVEKDIEVIKDLQLREGRWKVHHTGEYPLLPFPVETENLVDVRDRVVNAITRIAEENEGKIVLVVSHEGAVKQFVKYLGDTEDCKLLKYEGVRSAVNHFRYDAGHWTCVELNDDRHLRRVPVSSLLHFLTYTRLRMMKVLAGFDRKHKLFFRRP